MATDLQKILRMRKPKGMHVGAAVLLNLVNDFKCAGMPHEPLFSQEKLSGMINSFTSEHELAVYSNYADIASGIEQLFDYVEGSFQKAMHGYSRIISVFSKLAVREYSYSTFAPGDPKASALAENIANCAVIPFKTGSDSEYVAAAYRDLFLPGIRELLAFNAFMIILSTVTGVSELVQIEARVSAIHEALAFLNSEWRNKLPISAVSMFPDIELSSLRPDNDKGILLIYDLKNINMYRCPQLKKLKTLMLSTIDGRNA